MSSETAELVSKGVTMKEDTIAILAVLMMFAAIAIAGCPSTPKHKLGPFEDPVTGDAPNVQTY